METKHLFRNQSPGVQGYVYYDESNKRRGGSLQPGESVWLTERDLVATAGAPKNPANNPLENGHLVHEASEGDPGHTRPIGIPGVTAPSLTPEPAPEEEKSPEEPTGDEEAPDSDDTADEAARKEAAAEEAEKEAAAAQKIKEAEEAEAKAKEAQKKMTPAEEAAQRVGKDKADLSVKPPEGGKETTATEGETQGKEGNGKRSSQEATGAADALSD